MADCQTVNSWLGCLPNVSFVRTQGERHVI